MTCTSKNFLVFLTGRIRPDWADFSGEVLDLPGKGLNSEIYLASANPPSDRFGFAQHPQDIPAKLFRFT